MPCVNTTLVKQQLQDQDHHFLRNMGQTQSSVTSFELMTKDKFIVLCPFLVVWGL